MGNTDGDAGYTVDAEGKVTGGSDFNEEKKRLGDVGTQDRQRIGETGAGGRSLRDRTR
jgi:hypothetical protein